MDNRLLGAGERGKTGESHFGIAPVVFAHQPLAALGIACHDGQLGGHVDTLKPERDAFVQRHIAFVAPARQVHEPCLDTCSFQHECGNVGGMRLSQTGQQFTHPAHMFGQPEVTVGAKPLQIEQAVARTLDPVAHEIRGVRNVGGVVERFAMCLFHRDLRALQRVEPAVVVVVFCKKSIDPLFARLLVFEQQVGDAAKGRHDENAVVGIVLLDEQAIAQFMHPAHRRPADLFDRVVSFVDLVLGHLALLTPRPRRGRRNRLHGAPRSPSRAD